MKTTYTAKIGGKAVEFKSTLTITHAILISGKRIDGEVFAESLFSTVGRADLVEAAAKKARKIFENVSVVEVQVAPLVTAKFKRDLAQLVGI